MSHVELPIEWRVKNQCVYRECEGADMYKEIQCSHTKQIVGVNVFKNS